MRLRPAILGMAMGLCAGCYVGGPQEPEYDDFRNDSCYQSGNQYSAPNGNRFVYGCFPPLEGHETGGPWWDGPEGQVHVETLAVQMLEPELYGEWEAEFGFEVCQDICNQYGLPGSQEFCAQGIDAEVIHVQDLGACLEGQMLQVNLMVFNNAVGCYCQ